MKDARGADIVRLEVKRNSLGAFISGLLGQRRSIETAIRRRDFAIDMPWILSLDDLIQQRVESQNHAELIDLVCRAIYNNGKMRTIPTREALRSFNDLSQDESAAIDIRWTYLITFPGSEIPEKQEIRFLATSDRDIVFTPRSRKSSRFSLWENDDRENEIYFMVSATNLTWGEDISSTIQNMVDAHFRPRRWRERVSRLVTSRWSFPLAMLASLIGMMWQISSVKSPDFTSRIAAEKAAAGDFAAVFNSKLDLLLEIAATRLSTNFSFFYFVFPTLILSIPLIGSLIVPGGAVILNNYTLNKYNDYVIRVRALKAFFLVTVIVGIVVGIAGNKIYDELKKIGVF